MPAAQLHHRHQHQPHSVPRHGPGDAGACAGRIDFLCEIITTAKPQIEGRNVKALAIFDTKRSPALPDLPTAAEQGTDKLVAYTWNAIFLPKGAPAAIVNKLNAAAQAAVKTACTRSTSGLGAEIASDDQMTPQYLAQLVKSEIEKWAGPIKASGISVD